MIIKIYYDGKRLNDGDLPYEEVRVRDWVDFWDKWYRYGDFIYCGGVPGEDETHLKKDRVIKVVGEVEND